MSQLPPDCHRKVPALYRWRSHPTFSLVSALPKAISIISAARSSLLPNRCDVQGNGCGSMAEPAADGDHVHAGGNQLAGVGVAQRVQTYRRQFEFCQQLPPLGRGGVGTSQRAVPPREDKIVIAGTTAPA